jgi:hypothetical protein
MTGGQRHLAFVRKRGSSKIAVWGKVQNRSYHGASVVTTKPGQSLLQAVTRSTRPSHRLLTPRLAPLLWSHLNRSACGLAGSAPSALDHTTFFSQQDFQVGAPGSSSKESTNIVRNILERYNNAWTVLTGNRTLLGLLLADLLLTGHNYSRSARTARVLVDLLRCSPLALHVLQQVHSIPQFLLHMQTWLCANFGTYSCATAMPDSSRWLPLR